jgi:hypothetical protein
VNLPYKNVTMIGWWYCGGATVQAKTKTGI